MSGLDGLSIVAARLTAARAFDAESRILMLPASAILTKDDAQSTSLLKYLDPEDGALLPPRFPHWSALPDSFALALQLALQLGMEPESSAITMAESELAIEGLEKAGVKVQGPDVQLTAQARLAMAAGP